jgi:hypothetical protein
VLNVAVTGSSTPGFVTIFPCGSSRPNAASLNFAAGQTISNAVTAKVGNGGKICIFVFASTHVIIDVTGFFPGSQVADPSNPGTTNPPPSGPKQKFQAVYAYSSNGRPLNTGGIEPLIGQEIRSVLNWYDGETGGRHPDFVMDATGLLPSVVAAQVSMSSGEIAAQGGYDQAAKQVKNALPAHVYPVIFYDGPSRDGFCGVTSSAGYVFIPMANCGGNGYPKLQGWPYGPTYLIGHELTHALGAVPNCAPNFIPGGHVGNDPRDVVYEGPQPKDFLNTRLDPGRDDYYGHNRPGCTDIANSPLLSP